MHEVSLINDTLQIIQQSCEVNGIKTVKRIYLGIGELACVEPHSLHYAFEILKEDTICKSAELLIEYIPAKGYCQLCKQEFPITYFDKLCPRCQIPDYRKVCGYEMTVLRYDGEEA